MVRGDCYVTLMISFEKEIITLTFLLNVLIGRQKKIMTLIFTLDVPNGQLNSHMIESFAYLTNSECLLCNGHCGPRLNKFLTLLCTQGKIPSSTEHT